MTIRRISKGLLHGNKSVFERLLNLYPAFLFFGAGIKFNDAFTSVKIRLPLRWYTRNGHGTFFGGAILAVSDPFPAIMLSKAIPWASTWTKAHGVEFLKPGKTTLFAQIEIEADFIQSIEKQLRQDGKFVHTFQYYFLDKRGDKIALVSSTVYMRNPKHPRYVQHQKS